MSGRFLFVYTQAVFKDNHGLWGGISGTCQGGSYLCTEAVFKEKLEEWDPVTLYMLELALSHSRLRSPAFRPNDGKIRRMFP